MEFMEYSDLEPGAALPLNIGILNMPNEDYHASAGIGNSGLGLVARSPAHYNYAPAKDSTRAMVIGSAIHCSLLEPEKFAEEYLLLRDVKDRRASAYKEAVKAHGNGDFVLTAGESDQVKGMQDSVYAQQHAKALLETDGTREVAIYTKDKETGVIVKIKIDILTASGRIIDLKKTTDSRPEAFSKSIFNYRYHVQAAFYSDVYEWATGEKLATYGILCVEQEIPNAAMLYVIDDEALAMGRALYRKALNTYAKCMESKEWPAYSDKPQIISLPPWGLKQNEAELATGVESNE
ncbi:MAG: hypothetical protein COA78_06860 [Blastopirellula sp.]|nr:MAG: hypothetical protein COA78_06860 [Blastopirellula sp.]